MWDFCWCQTIYDEFDVLLSNHFILLNEFDKFQRYSVDKVQWSAENFLICLFLMSYHNYVGFTGLLIQYRTMKNSATIITATPAIHPITIPMIWPLVKLPFSAGEKYGVAPLS